MKSARELRIEQLQNADWHATNCDIEIEETLYGDWGTQAICVQHLIDVTSELPDPIEPDAYTNYKENDLL